MAFMQDGRVIAGGTVRMPGPVNQHTGMVRVIPSGAIDPSFGPCYTQVASQLKIEGEYIYYQNGGTGFRRNFLLDGTPDYTYGTSWPPMFSTSQVSSYHIFPDGTQWRMGDYIRKIYDEDGQQIGIQPGYGLVQAMPNGDYDPGFDHKYTPGTYLRNLSVEPDGRFLFSASNAFTYEGTPVGALFKLWPDGQLDTTFHTSITWSGGVSDEKYHYPDGRMLVFGRFMAPEYPNDTLAVMRLLPDGSTDTTWPSIPFLAYGYFRGLAAVWDYLEIEPGKLIVVGDFNAIGLQPLGAIVAIDTAGNVLWNYLPGTGAGVMEDMGTNNSYCLLHVIREGPDGFIYLCGSFSGYNDGCGDHPEQRLLMRLFPLDVGVKENKKVGSPFVAPNPGNGLFQIRWPGYREFDLEVRDGLGRIVHREHILREGDNVELPHVKAGVYNLLVTAPDGTRASAKLMKQ
ncbi:MAG: delta-60 repeat domain-containing protein [Bacteroidetes bacterium]|nr:delta-60 repeat domain-containing protein [Bacteroidota bacterium]